MGGHGVDHGPWQAGRPRGAPARRLRAGVLAAQDLETRDRRLATLTAVLALSPVPVDDDVAAAWARLRVALRDSGCRMAVNDSWIAATAIALDIPLVTQDDDHVDVPGLRVIRA